MSEDAGKIELLACGLHESGFKLLSNNQEQVDLSKGQWQINLANHSQVVAGSDDQFFVILRITAMLSGKLEKGDADKKDYLEIIAAWFGVFKSANIDSSKLDTFKNVSALTILYPFVREHILSLSQKAWGLSPLILPIVNFQQRYQEMKKKSKS